jgi:photosystem II stability/assembly factor-like uncharacterized protein
MRAHHFARSSRLSLVIVFLLASIAWPFQSNQAAPASQTTPYQEDFESGLASGWKLEPGWKVELDGTNHVLAGQGHFWARFDQAFEGDLRLSFRLKILNGTIHLVPRMNDAGRYFIGFNASESYLSKQYWPDEFHNSLVTRNTAHSLNKWYLLEIRFQGNQVNFLVDGYQEWSYTDAKPFDQGSLAFETLDDAQAYVDDIRVEKGTATTGSPTEAAATATQSAPGVSTWQRLGGPLGGLGYDIRMRPGSPGVMYVTDAWAGVFMSTDGGAIWFPSNQGIATRAGPSGDAIPVFSLTVDPNNPDIIWIGTQFQRGIFKSTDGGKTWQRRVNGVVELEGITFRGFSVDPTNSDVVYAAAELSSWAWSTDHQQHIGREFDLTGGVIYKTTDGGQSWRVVWRGDNLARYIWINPLNTNVLYISTGFFDREAANSDPVAGRPGGEGILKSTDGGQTWQAVNNGLGNLYVTSLFMHPTEPDTLLAATGNIQYHHLGGVYLTTNGGASWKRVLDMGDEGIFEAVEISTLNPEIAYAGNDQAIYRSEDGGQTWKQQTTGGYWGPAGVRAGFPIDFQTDPRNPDRLFSNEYGGGNFLSEDGGRTWIDASHGYTGAQVRDLAVDPTRPGRLISAARSGIFVSLDGGYDWQGLNFPPAVSMEWNAIAIDPDDPQHLLAATNWNGLLESRTAGRSLTLVAELPGRRAGWRAVAFAPSDVRTAYAGIGGFYSAGTFDNSMPGGGIFVSRDGGTTWLPANDSLSQNANVTNLAVDPSDPQTVYAATSNHGLMKTTDGGQSWTRLAGSLLATQSALSIAIQPDQTNHLLVGLDRGAVFKSLDGGLTWTRSASGLNPEASVSDIVFNPANPVEIYLADMSSGVYRSTDGGQHWQDISQGLESRAVNALVISMDGQHLYAASEGMGVFRLDSNGQPPEAVPTSTLLPLPTFTPVSLPTSTNPVQSGPTPVQKSGPLCNSLLLPVLFAMVLLLRPRRSG